MSGTVEVQNTSPHSCIVFFKAAMSQHCSTDCAAASVQHPLFGVESPRHLMSCLACMSRQPCTSDHTGPSIHAVPQFTETFLDIETFLHVFPVQ